MRALAWCGIVAPVLRVSMILTLGLLHPDYSQLRDYISELGARGAPFAFVMNSMIGLVGVLLGLFSVALYRASKRGFFAVAGTALLALSGLSFVAVGLFPCDPGCSLAAPSASMRMHLIAGIVAMATQTLAPLAFGVHFVSGPGDRGYGIFSLTCGAVASAALVALFGLGDALSFPGLAQKTFQVATDLWVLVSAIHVLGLRAGRYTTTQIGTITFRTAAASEGEVLSALALRAKAHWGYSSEFIEACRAELSYSPEQVEAPGATFVVAEVAGALIGFYALQRVSATEFELDALFVEPARICQGIGRALIEHAKEAAAKAGGRALTVQADPHAECFYRAAGGMMTGKRESGSIPGRYLPMFTIPLSNTNAATTAVSNK